MCMPNITDLDHQIRSSLDRLPPITLEQMESIKLMNRLDTKYVATKRQLIELLKLVEHMITLKLRLL